MLYSAGRSSEFRLRALSQVRNIMFGIATILIVLYHSTDLSFTFLKWQPLIRLCETIQNYSHIGVDIFLLFSGIGLFFSLSANGDVKTFYLRRLKRILPAVLMVSFIYNALIPHTNGIIGYFTNSLLLSFFINGSRTFWYFSFIILLYVIYPLIHFILKRKHLSGFLVMMAVAVAINVAVLLFLPSYYVKVEIALGRIPVFITGAWLGQYVMDDKTISRKGAVWISFFVLLVTFFSVMFFNNTIKEYPILNRMMYCPAAVSFSILCAVLFSGLRLSVLRKSLIAVGMYSMEIYLLFEKVAMFAKDTFYTDTYHICFYISVFVLTLILSIVLHITCNQLLSLSNKQARS